jgi:deoxyuridine 5'-triphosphate nucleotidohydrolase
MGAWKPKKEKAVAKKEEMDEDVIKELQAELKKKEKKIDPIRNSDKVFHKGGITNVDDSFENNDREEITSVKLKKPKGMVTSSPSKESLKLKKEEVNKTSQQELNAIILNVKKLHKDAIIPTKAYPTDAGWDLYSTEDVKLRNGNYSPTIIPTGIAIEFPKGYWGQIESRSGLSCQGAFTIGGIIDQTYTGEIKVIMHYLGTEPIITLKKGSKIAQLVLRNNIISKITEVSDVGETDRGEKGFGSSGA